MSSTVYLPVALGLISLLFASVMLLVWRWIDRQAHVLCWAAAYLAATLQWLCLLRAEFAPGVFFWVAGNGFAIATISLALAGYRRRGGLGGGGGALPGAGFLVLAAVLWFAAVEPHAGLAAGVVPLYSSALIAASVHALLWRRRPVLAAEWASAALLAFFALVELAAGLIALAAGPAGAPEWLARLEMLHYLTLPAAYTAVGTLMIFLVATDLSEQMKQLAITDQLTGVLNRRGFVDAALRAIGRARRAQQPLVLVMADLDHFKRINDTYGHGTGDRALARFAAHLAAELRQGDLVGRIGGEEFALALANTDLEAGMQVARRLCRGIDLAALEVGGARVRITASFGVALLSPSDGDVEDLMERADRGLYQAKETGRNRVCAAPPERPEPDFASA